MTEPIRSCSDGADQAKVNAVSRALGVSLPNCSLLRVTSTDGVVATSVDAAGNAREVEVTSRGDVYFSRWCLFGRVCSGAFSNNVRQLTHPVSPDKLEAARALIRGPRR